MTTRTRLTGPMSKRLLTARLDAGFSREQLAELTGLSPRCIAYYEDADYGRNRKPAFVRAWAEATGRAFEELWGTPGKEISRRAWNGGTPSPFLTRNRHPEADSGSTLPLRRRSA